MESPRWAAMEASVRSEVARIVAQNLRFERAVAFALVHPYEAYERLSRRYGAAVNQFPTAVVCMVGNFRSFCRGPSGSIVT
eukprot:1918273-Pleurochrysis_carterae.AAC.2